MVTLDSLQSLSKTKIIENLSFYKGIGIPETVFVYTDKFVCDDLLAAAFIDRHLNYNIGFICLNTIYMLRSYNVRFLKCTSNVDNELDLDSLEKQYEYMYNRKYRFYDVSYHSQHLNRTVKTEISKNWAEYSQFYSILENKLDSFNEEIKLRLNKQKELKKNIAIEDNEFVINYRHTRKDNPDYFMIYVENNKLTLDIVDSRKYIACLKRELGENVSIKDISYSELADKFVGFLDKNTNSEFRFKDNLEKILKVAQFNKSTPQLLKMFLILSGKIETNEKLNRISLESDIMPVEIELDKLIIEINKLLNNEKTLLKLVGTSNEERYESLKRYGYVGDKIKIRSLGDTLEVSINLYSTRVKSQQELVQFLKRDIKSIFMDIYAIIKSGGIKIKGEHAPLNFYSLKSYKLLGNSELIYMLKLKTPDYEKEINVLDTLNH